MPLLYYNDVEFIMARPASILIVDDSAASRIKLTEILEAQGYLVTVATSAEEAVPLFYPQRNSIWSSLNSCCPG